jgi:hypothetical protein
MSIVRIGLSETDKFSEGYDAIFGKKKRTPKQASTTAKPSKSNASKKTKKK